MTTIRPANLEDAGRLFELLCQFATSSTPNRSVFDSNYPLILDDRNTLLRVAEDAGVVVGYSLAIRQWTLHANGPIVLLQELMVDPDRRRQGIGTLLIEAMLAEARQGDAVEVTLATRRAKDYYPRFGFSERAGYFKLKL